MKEVQETYHIVYVQIEVVVIWPRERVQIEAAHMCIEEVFQPLHDASVIHPPSSRSVRSRSGGRPLQLRLFSFWLFRSYVFFA